MEKTVFATLLLVFTILSLLSPSRTNGLGFSVDLIHRDSPLSPFYNPSLTSFERLSQGLNRSQNRAYHFISACEQNASSEISPSGGGYLMKIALGRPGVTIFAYADTGSDLTWTQCAPCIHCYKQKAPLFYPNKSSTYKVFPCKSATCLSLYEHKCTLNRTCEYHVLYGDKSYTRGALASETLTLGSKNIFLDINFGCGFDNGGTFSENGSGIVGLGGGSTSLISQLKSSIHGKFSYCLTPLLSDIRMTSKINFGENAIDSGDGVVSTPIIRKSPKTFYFLTLEAFSIGKNRVDVFNFSSNSHIVTGNTIIDSGTTLTYLPKFVYNPLELLVKKAIGSKTVPSPEHTLNLCYRISDNPSIPTISAHFTGATIDLKPVNTFVRIAIDVTCFAFVAVPQGNFLLYGNIAQNNFLVGYDLVKNILYFKPEKCGHVTH